MNNELVRNVMLDDCYDCPNIKDVLKKLENTIYDNIIANIDNWIESLLWLLNDDHKHNNHNYDDWTNTMIALLNKYKEYVEQCRKNGKLPKSFEEWKSNKENLLNNYKDIYKDIELNECDRFYKPTSSY